MKFIIICPSVDEGLLLSCWAVKLNWNGLICRWTDLIHPGARAAPTNLGMWASAGKDSGSDLWPLTDCITCHLEQRIDSSQIAFSLLLQDRDQNAQKAMSCHLFGFWCCASGGLLWQLHVSSSFLSHYYHYILFLIASSACLQILYCYLATLNINMLLLCFGYV